MNNRQDSARKQAQNNSEAPRKVNNTQASRNEKNVRPPNTHQNAKRTVSRSPRASKGLSDNLRSQTPLNRKLQKITAPSEPAAERRRNAPQHFKVKQKKSARKRSLTQNAATIILGLVAYAILLPICILSVALALPHHTTPETNDFTYQLGTGKNVYSIKVFGYKTVRRGGVYYIDMDGLAEYCDLTTTGNSKRMRYVVRETGESIEFVIGESIAYINGVSERTDSTVFLSGGKVYVPLSFAKRCFQGINITLDLDNNKITIDRQQDGNGGFLDLSFPYKLPDLSPSINFAELDPEIQNDIIMQNQPSAPETPESGTNGNTENEQ